VTNSAVNSLFCPGGVSSRLPAPRLLPPAVLLLGT
jgi:hypothetical protein